MITVTRLEDLGHFRNDWLEARYHFSFSSYQDPARMGWGALRVWNDDIIQPGGGFAPHSHQDMEIVSYLRQGAITHEDGLGNKGVTRAGDVQVMSAGTASSIRNSTAKTASRRCSRSGSNRPGWRSSRAGRLGNSRKTPARAACTRSPRAATATTEH